MITLLSLLAVPVLLAGAAFWFVQATPNARAAERVLQIGGALAGAGGGVVLGFTAVILSNVMIGARHTPIGPLVAIGGNVLLVYFTYQVTGQKLLAALPGVVWFMVTFWLSQKGPGSDLLLQGNWVGVLTLLGGSVAWGLTAYRLIHRSPVKPAD